VLRRGSYRAIGAESFARGSALTARPYWTMHTAVTLARDNQPDPGACSRAIACLRRGDYAIPDQKCSRTVRWNGVLGT
jgi:hypothetical protein